ncbi:MAG TPA: hypothetical protein VFJ14_07380 [Nocardioidaceae bacterium]|nr:hypothetical protein [Nocardioidaceae bacterium]
MGVKGWLARQAVVGAHALVVESPGAWLTRVAVEQALVRRGWRAAASAADADVLVVCGQPGARLAGAIDHVWDQLPGPRARTGVAAAADADAALDQVRSVLLDDRGQRGDAAARAVAPAGAESAPERDDGDDGGHHGGDHGEMGMSGPGGIPLASGASARDGLGMDVVHLPLGPVLPYWPPGLVLWTTMQGDVAAEVEVELLDAEDAPLPDRERRSLRSARRCDAAAAMLMLAGWDSAAVAARRARDGLLTGASASESVSAVARLHARVARSRVLRWSLRDLGRLDDEQVAEHLLPQHLRGDAHDRLLRLLTACLDQQHDEAPTERDLDPSAVAAALPPLLTGLDLAAVRLVVASLVPFAAARAAPVGGGPDA